MRVITPTEDYIYEETDTYKKYQIQRREKLKIILLELFRFVKGK